MSVFTANMLKKSRNSAGLTQVEVTKLMKISRRRLISIEANESQVTSDEIVLFA